MIQRGEERGQLVLLAGVVVAVALLGMLVAYLQLGYTAQVGASGDRAVGDATAFLDRATHEVGRDLRGEYGWREREAAAAAARDQLQPHRRTLERTRVEGGVVATTDLNGTAASEWAGANCPGGQGREFGPCEADGGIVVQRRGDRTLVLAVAYDLTVTTERSTTTMTVVSTTG